MKKVNLEDLLPYELQKVLTPAEKNILQKAQIGELADLRTGRSRDDDPENDKAWDSDRTVHAEFLNWLCTDNEVVQLIHAKGVQIAGVKIPTLLNLENCALNKPLTLIGCSIRMGLDLRNAKLSDLTLRESLTGNITAEKSITTGSINLWNTRSHGEVRFTSAKIGGDLLCKGTKLMNPNEDPFVGAFVADRLFVDGSVFFVEGFEAEGEVRLPGAKIGGSLECSGAKFRNLVSHALTLDATSIDGSVTLCNSEISLRKFRANGEVRMVGAKIGGDLNCIGAIIKNQNGYALNADRLKIEIGVYLNDGFFEGETRFVAANIGGNLECSRAIFTNSKDCALNAANIVVNNDVIFSEIWAVGEVHMQGASVGGDLNCSFSDFENRDGHSLNLENANIKNSLNMKNLGELSGEINLTNTKVKQLSDDSNKWQKGQKLTLDGFEYDRFSMDSPREATERLLWLSLQPTTPFRPQPYEQLAKFFRSIGMEIDVRKVLIEKQESLRKYGSLNLLSKLWNRFLGITISHGYKPWKVIFYFIIPIIFAGGGIFWYAEKTETMVPSKESIYTALAEGIFH
jgi:hypothetical protein